MQTYEFTVAGRGPFPVDMLRYDCAYPKNTSDAQSVLEPREQREVTLYGAGAPTVDRWRSFGWVVTTFRIL